MRRKILPLEIIFSIIVIVVILSIIVLICLQMKLEMQIINKNSEASFIASNILENMKTRSYDETEKYIQEFSGIGVAKKIENKLQNIIIYGDKFEEKFFGTEIPEGYVVEFNAETVSEFSILKSVNISVMFWVNDAQETFEVTTILEREKIEECNAPVIKDEYFAELNVNTTEYDIIPIRYSKEHDSFITTTKDDEEWYNYSSKKWAKVLIFPKHEEQLQYLFIDDNDIVKNSINYKGYNLNVNDYIYAWIPNFSIKDNITYFRYGAGKKAIKMEFLYENGNYLYLNKVAEDIKDISTNCSFDGRYGVWRKLNSEDEYYSIFNSTQYGPINLY